MQVLDTVVCQLSNFEVRDSLEAWRGVRGREHILPSSDVFDIERKVLWMLKSDEGLSQEGNVAAFLSDLDRFCSGYPTPEGGPVKLTQAEKLQFLNIKPTNVMQIELIIEDLRVDARIRPEFEETLKHGILRLVKIHLLRSTRRRNRTSRDAELYISSEEEAAEGEEEAPPSPPEFCPPIPEKQTTPWKSPLGGPLWGGLSTAALSPGKAQLPPSTLAGDTPMAEAATPGAAAPSTQAANEGTDAIPAGVQVTPTDQRLEEQGRRLREIGPHTGGDTPMAVDTDVGTPAGKPKRSKKKSGKKSGKKSKKLLGGE